MTRNDLRSLLHARPFKPLVLRLADGHKAEIPHPEFAALSPDGSTVVIFGLRGLRHIIDTLLVVSVEVNPHTAK